MEPAQFDLNLYQYSKAGLVIAYENPDETPITFVDALMQVRLTKETPRLILDLKNGQGFVVDPDEGTATFDFDYLADTLKGTVFNAAWYDLFIIDPTGDPFPLLAGRSSLTRAVTHVG